MSKIYKLLLSVFFLGSISLSVSAQQRYWSAHSTGIAVDVNTKTVSRQSFPKEFKLFDLSTESLQQQLMSVTDKGINSSVIISLPNAEGTIEQFRVYETSNFEPALQARFPQIRAFTGTSLTDRYATLKLSLSPQGIQTMVFRTDKQNEFMEPYSKDGSVYAVYRSVREKGALPWNCSTQDQQMFAGLNGQIAASGRIESNAGQLKTMRLAQSCNGEYANFFGATSSAQVALVLAAFNATLTRCNGVYEKDLALHLNLVPETENVIFYNPATDPYTTLGNWNTELQITLNTTLTGPGTPLATNNAAYDIGHMFGASGGGGNAGCIGCVCVDGTPSGTGSTKGRGITSPADNIPMGDNFDIDYVAHEVGHQLGANHTFSMSNEGTGVNKEVGSGITIMGYAGITAQDVAPHSIDIFHEASIQQIQNNLATKTCPITVNMTANTAPTVSPQGPYIIPISTPFSLTGVATDAESDPLTYCWEQDDNGTGQTGNNSVAYPTKPTGPNWLSFPATVTPTRLFPRLSTILAGLSVTPVLPGGDAIANIEALSSIGRTLNYRLTVRDNRPYVPGSTIGQTNFTDVVVTVNASGGPFLITSQNTATSWFQGSTQTITWSVNNTTAAPFNVANVNILFSSDGGNTFSMLVANTPNDGTQDITVPSLNTTLGRIKVEAVGNIFFDINNVNITVAPPPNGFTFNSPAAVTAACPAPNIMTSGNLTATYQGTFTGDINLSGVVSPAGPTVSFSTNPLSMGSPSTTVSLTGMSTLSPGNYVVTVTGVGVGGPTVTRDITFTINPGSGPAITTQPASQAICVGSNVTFTAAGTGVTGYQWQISTNGGTTWTNIGGQTTASYTITGVTTGLNNNQYRCVLTGQCGSTNSNAAVLTINTLPAITGQPANIAVCSGSSASFSVTATGSGLTYQWEVSTNGGTTWTPVAGANASTYTVMITTVAMNNDQYHCVVSGTCTPSQTSNAAVLTVNSSVTVTGNPTNKTICEGTGTTFVAAASGTGLNYQWEVSTNGGTTWANVVNNANYSGATSATLTLTNTPPAFNNNRYRCTITSPPCTPGVTTVATLTVNTFPVITSQPASATICEGGNYTFNVTATTAVGSLTYQWQLSTNGGTTWTNIAGATNSSFSMTGVNAAQNGYRFRVVVTAGCGSSNSNAATITVNTFPVASITSLPTNLCLSDPAYALTASQAGGVWSGPGVTGSSFTPSAAGVGTKTISYVLTNAGCVTTKTSIVQVNVCAERQLRLNDFQAVTVYPVPNNGQFSIRLNTEMYNSLGVKVFNSMGQQVHAKQFSGLTYGSIVSLDIRNDVPAGVYQLFIYSTDLGNVDTKGVKIVVIK